MIGCFPIRMQAFLLYFSVDRLEERLSEQKKEYGVLHQRHTEVMDDHLK